MNPTAPTLAETTLAELATQYPGAAPVFMRHGLDFCCRGRRPVSEAASEKGLDVEVLLREIRAKSPFTLTADLTVWRSRPVSGLIGHILDHYHVRLRESLPHLVTMAEKVERVHAEKPTAPRGLHDHLRSMTVAALEHMAKEEQAVFPAMLNGSGRGLALPVQVLEREHDDHGRDLETTRRLTNGLVPPPEACTTWRALYLGLETVERELMEHIHLENNVLFPRVLCA